MDERDATDLGRLATFLVQASLAKAVAPSPALVARLRSLERRALALQAGPQILQVLASGRRLLGDAVAVPAVPRSRRARGAGAPHPARGYGEVSETA
ncbi:hypothetical protein [Methylobacterium sp. A54F]